MSKKNTNKNVHLGKLNLQKQHLLPKTKQSKMTVFPQIPVIKTNCELHNHNVSTTSILSSPYEKKYVNKNNNYLCYSDTKKRTSISSLSDIESYDHSSSSSTSWFEEFDNEAAMILINQLDNIDSVLYGENEISILPQYLQDECVEWMKAFPHLRIIGEGMNKYSSTYTKETKEFITTRSAPVLTKKSHDKLSSSINIWNPLQEKTSAKIKKYGHQKLPINNNKQMNETLNAFSSLTIQPFSYSVMKSELSASKWQRDQNLEFLSLPCMKPNNGKKLSTEKNTYFTPRTKSIDVNKISLDDMKKQKYVDDDLTKEKNTLCFSPDLKKTQDNNVIFFTPRINDETDKYYLYSPIDNKSFVLPPINSRYNNCFRSISATPRKYMVSQDGAELSSKCTTSGHVNKKTSAPITEEDINNCLSRDFQMKCNTNVKRTHSLKKI